MPTVYALLPDAKPHFLDSAGDPLSGGKLFIYTAGSSTKATTYTESDGVTPNSNPIVLNSRGETGSGVYAATGSYKLVLAPANDTDPPASAIWTRDDITPINDIAGATATEWESTGLTPTYISATQFSLVGDQTTDHHVGRRFKATVSAGTVYGYISVSAYTSLTTVTVVNDSGTLDAGLSDVSLSFLREDNLSLPTPYGIVGTEGQAIVSNGTNGAWANRVTLGTADDETGSPTAITFTGIPASANMVFMTLVGVSTSGTSPLLVKLGVSGGLEDTGYTSQAITQGGTAGASTAGFRLTSSTAAADTVSGIVTLYRMSGNTWVSSSNLLRDTGGNAAYASGSKTLAGALDRIAITTIGGSDTFDAADINIGYM